MVEQEWTKAEKLRSIYNLMKGGASYPQAKETVEVLYALEVIEDICDPAVLPQYLTHPYGLVRKAALKRYEFLRLEQGRWPRLKECWVRLVHRLYRLRWVRLVRLLCETYGLYSRHGGA